ncbi:hypothetical protein NDU88_004388 [Pleurodeles waltl]|uniref:Uncharacterized protein n=1 Tax=Pleurodeles waltl TaxID=8319 RepID=A0AAV7M678_PLEWA|nr:hypothetical protein NDU88_004388 [Pleurodeles waltl]
MEPGPARPSRKQTVAMLSAALPSVAPRSPHNSPPITRLDGDNLLPEQPLPASLQPHLHGRAPTLRPAVAMSGDVTVESEDLGSVVQEG